MAERRNGAGSRLSGVLERTTPHSPGADDESGLPADQGDGAEGEPIATKGRGGAARKVQPPAGRAAKKIKGHTIYLPDDLFERILVQAHRRNRTISEYVAAILDRQVPDHRIGTREPVEG